MDETKKFDLENKFSVCWDRICQKTTRNLTGNYLKNCVKKLKMLKFLHLLIIPVFVNISLVEATAFERNYASLISSICSLYDASSVIVIRNHPTEGIRYQFFKNETLDFVFFD